MNMTPKQKIMKAAYPLISRFNKTFKNDKKITINKQPMQPPVSFYDLSIQMNDGT